MLKNSLIIALLTGECKSYSSKKLLQGEPNDLVELQLSSGLGASFTPQSCTSGIERFNSKSNSLSTYNKVKSSTKKWDDPDFPADDTSLQWGQFGFGNIGENDDGLPKLGMKWLRPSETYDGQDGVSFFGKSGKPRPQGVQQMQLGDCWFLAAGSSVAEKEHRIQKIMSDKNWNKEGIFRFKFWVKNKWVSVNVDERIPVSKFYESYIPWATNPSLDGAWWMPMLEKAYAKLNQNYDRIIGGNGFEGLRSLTGMPVYNLVHDEEGPYSEHQISEFLRHFAKKNYPSVAGCCKNGGNFNLVDGHVYSFLDVADLKDSAGNTVHTIVKLRNPASTEFYTGPWNDQDPKWTEAWKKQVNLVVAGDGIFWMNWNDYLQYFSNTAVAFYEDANSPYHHQMHELMANEPEYRYMLTNPTNQHVYIMVETFSKRLYPRDEKCSRDFWLEVEFFKDDWETPVEREIDEVNINSNFAFVGQLKDELPAGKYGLFIYNHQDDVDLTIHIYATKESPKLEIMQEE